MGANAAAWDNGFNVVHERPNVCPLEFTQSEIAGGGKYTDFEALVSVPAGITTTPLDLNFYDRFGDFVDPFHYAYGWSVDPSDPDRRRAQASGDYDAGTGGFSAFGRVEKDLALLSTTLTNGQVAVGQVDITYKVHQAAAIVAASDVPEYQSFSVGTQINDPLAVHPRTYEWFQDGASLGSGQGWSELQVSGLPGGTTRRYQVVVTDASGNAVTTTEHTVWVYPDGSVSLFLDSALSLPMCTPRPRRNAPPSRANRSRYSSLRARAPARRSVSSSGSASL